ncbi:MAG TPA: ATP-dependent Clp protease proteolytic subunit [Tepidisphaeraceae bacterium]|nr:ATP-dependent Clp protease proteolytic subunit [Tepidisphaeraceae bacterium]
MGRRFTLALCAALLVPALAGSVFGDEILKKDGTRLTGTVVAETAEAVTIETVSGGITLRQKVARAQVAAVRRAAREGPGYCAIPIDGAIGDDVTADALDAAIRAARTAKARYVVLVIDSPGGQVSEMARIVEVLRANRDLVFVAYVKHAYSAAAMIALACPRIVMAPGASIGAAVPFKVGPDGMPVAVQEKMESAVRAEMRSAAALGGHDALWVRGMSEIDLELAIDATSPTADGKPVLRRAAAAPGLPLIKRRGQILTLTADEATAAGLAVATAADVDAVKSSLSLAAWHASDERPGRMMADSVRARRVDRQREQERQQRAADRHAYYKEAVVEVRELDRRIRRAIEQVEERRAAAREVNARYQAEAKALADDCNLKLKRAAIAANPISTQKQLRKDYDQKVQAMEEQFRPQVEQARAGLKAAGDECQQLIDRRNALLANAPAAE